LRKVLGALTGLLLILPLSIIVCPASAIPSQSASIALLVNDINSLDGEEQASIAFGTSQGYSIAPIDGNYVINNPLTLQNYDGFWSNSINNPVSWNNQVALSALTNQLSSGKRILLDNSGMMIAHYLGYGNVRQDSWSPGAVDGVYLVDFDSSNTILSNLPKWQNLHDYQSLSVPLDNNRCLWMTHGQGPWGINYYYPSSQHPSSNQCFIGMYYAYGWDQMVQPNLDSKYGFNSVVAYPGRILVDQYTAPLHRDDCIYCLFREQSIGQGKIIVNGMGQHGPGISKDCKYGIMGMNLIASELGYIAPEHPYINPSTPDVRTESIGTSFIPIASVVIIISILLTVFLVRKQKVEQPLDETNDDSERILIKTSEQSPTAPVPIVRSYIAPTSNDNSKLIALYHLNQKDLPGSDINEPEGSILSSVGWSSAKSTEERRMALERSITKYGIKKTEEALRWVSNMHKKRNSKVFQKCQIDLQYLRSRRYGRH